MDEKKMIRYASVGRSILVIDKYFKLFFKNSLKKFNLNTAEAMALLVLYEHDGRSAAEIFKGIHSDSCSYDGTPGKTQDEIIDELHYDKSVMTRTMQSLEDKGYVLRNSNPNDNRSYIFTLTEAGTKLKPDIIMLLRDWNTLLLDGVDNLEILKESMDKMRSNAMQVIDKCCKK